MNASPSEKEIMAKKMAKELSGTGRELNPPADGWLTLLIAASIADISYPPRFLEGLNSKRISVASENIPAIRQIKRDLWKFHCEKEQNITVWVARGILNKVLDSHTRRKCDSCGKSMNIDLFHNGSTTCTTCTMKCNNCGKVGLTPDFFYKGTKKCKGCRHIK